MDAALIQAAGIPTVVFGPGGEGAHSVDEWVDLASVDACARRARGRCARAVRLTRAGSPTRR